MHAGADGSGSAERIATRELLARQIRRRLEQRQRVAGSGVVEPFDDLRRDRPAAQQLRGLRPVEAFDGQRLDAGEVQPMALDRPQRQHQRDRLALQPPRGEQQRIRGRVVEPVRVIDQRRTGRSAAAADSSPSAAACTTSRSAGTGGPSASAPSSARAWTAGSSRGGPAPAAAATASAANGRSASASAPVTVSSRAGALAHVLEQRRLADPRLADQRERTAVRRQPIQPFALLRATDEFRQGASHTNFASSVRERTPSLRKIRDRCTSIVFGLTKSAEATSRFVAPRATASATSSSCGVSSRVGA